MVSAIGSYKSPTASLKKLLASDEKQLATDEAQKNWKTAQAMIMQIALLEAQIAALSKPSPNAQSVNAPATTSPRASYVKKLGTFIDSTA